MIYFYYWQISISKIKFLFYQQQFSIKMNLSIDYIFFCCIISTKYLVRSIRSTQPINFSYLVVITEMKLDVSDYRTAD